MNHFEPLLAKNCDDLENIPTYAKLLPHLRAVERAGESIVEVVGKLILKQIDLPVNPWLSRLHRAVRVACLCHDIGKANEGFQKMVRPKGDPKLQPARHEFLSAILLLDKSSPIRKWALGELLKNSNNEDNEINEMLMDCVIGAVAGHHLKIDPACEKASIALKHGGCGSLLLQMLLTHPDLKPLFASTLTKEISFSLVEGEETYLGDYCEQFKKNSNHWWNKLKKNRDWWRFYAIVKALVTAADVVGSAMLPEKENIKKWVNETLRKRVSSSQMNNVVNVRLNGKKPRDFQRMIGESKGRVTLVEAGCGSGKTVAAYLWASYHAQNKKLFFCYPTTGTATEGFLGYVHETDVESELIHSRAIIDLEGITKVKDDEQNDHLLRIESLNIWSPAVIICTIDTVLALVRNNRRGLYNSPSILSGAFVFDELHAYDNKMFEAVVAFIKALSGASFLLMTASLPKMRKEFLLNCLKNDIFEVPSSHSLENLPRYLFQRLENEKNAFEKAFLAISANKRVLWICNTVKRAQNIFQRLKAQNIEAKTYHSRFKYKDRVCQHRELIQAFGDENQKGFVAITTQVAEMSLDLDADILISEVAPTPSLIQRLGRLNRRITPENPGHPRNAYFFMPENVLPYNPQKLQLAEQWLNQLINLNRPLSQTDLSEYFNNLPIQEDSTPDTRTDWLDSGWFAIPGQVRDEGYSVSVLMEEDELRCRQHNGELVKCTIPMNYSNRMEHWKEFKGHFIAPSGSIEYDVQTGATLNEYDN